MRTVLLITFFAAHALASDITFETLPASGALSAPPAAVVGWGYRISNNTSMYLLPLGLSNSGVIFGSLRDIFDYPVVDPQQTISQSYVFNNPGGFGNSLGLFEYGIPSGTPLGLTQSGTFELLYQFYDANPDLSPGAQAIGEPATLIVPFAVTTQDVPEPCSFVLVGSMFGIVGFAKMIANRRTRKSHTATGR